MRHFIYASESRLSCSACGGEVIICIPEGLRINGAPYINGELINVTEYSQHYCNTEYQYVIEYDEELLLDPEKGLSACDIMGIVCRGCLTRYIDYQDDHILDRLRVEDTVTLDLTYDTINHILKGDVNVSILEGNNLTIVSDGLYVNVAAAQTPLTVVDTNTVNLTASGVANHTVQADVIISPDAGNSISALGNGLYAPPLVANDSSTIDFTTSSPQGHTLTGEVRVSGSPGNLISVNADGIYASAPSSGISNLDLGAGCDAGAGPTQAIRQASISGSTLVLRSAPEHTFRVHSHGSTGTTNYTNVQSVGQYPSSSITVIVNNPSSCREAQYCTSMHGSVGVNVEPGGRCSYMIQEFVSGVWTTLYNGSFDTGQGVGARRTETFHLDLVQLGIIPAGGSSTRVYRFVAATDDAFNSGTNQYSNIQLSGIISWVGTV